MSGLNKTMLIGRLGADPEVKDIGGGKMVARLSVATSEAWGQGDNRQERTEWHRIVVWGKLAELCGKYLTKGRQVFVEGRIQTRKWENKDGQTQYTTEIVAQTVQFLGQQQNMDAGATSPTENYGETPQFDENEEIPF